MVTKCPYASETTRNGKQLRRIGHWQDLCAYYTDGENVFAVSGSQWIACGSETEFRDNFARRTRGELYPIPAT